MSQSIRSGIASGIVAGLTVSGIWAGVVACWYWLRNRNLEKGLRRTLTPRAVWYHRDGSVGIGIKNPTDYQVTIRGARIIGGERGTLVELGFREDSPEGPIHDKKRNWVDLPAHTEGVWSFNTAFVEQHGPQALENFKESVTPVTGFSITIEYKTLLGTTRVIDIEADSSADRTHIAESFERYFRGEKVFAG